MYNLAYQNTTEVSVKRTELRRSILTSPPQRQGPRPERVEGSPRGPVVVAAPERLSRFLRLLHWPGRLYLYRQKS